ncbi:hypothetical protein GJU43_03860 [Flavobacterium sp. LC2016-23]|uniref:M12 family metallopeptidase n=1 Tax=Flavobacterium sp. LC2016-23 TaxID=2666330 RepID=UPI0012B0FDAA|nr:M12 family metallopeptidase [Flavobacterium sp. LC2016-23]MRX38397.1 hypothetical protein [Flavobacterium sp. LC2016-23]
MKVQFTKKLTQNNFPEMKLALKERPDNLKVESLSNEKKIVLEKFQHKQHLLTQIGDFTNLSEMAAETRKLWRPNQTLKVFFFVSDKARDQRVLQYASIWSEHCSIKFERTDNRDEAQIRVGYDATGSWSYIGTDALGVDKHKATINFGWLSDSLPEPEYKQVVLHEFGHALGLIHEHQSPDIKMDWDKNVVYNYYAFTHGWSKADVDKNVFQEYDKTTIRYSEVDRDSIMGYYLPPEFTKNKQSFPFNYDLSATDKKYIGELYPELLHS